MTDETTAVAPETEATEEGVQETPTWGARQAPEEGQDQVEGDKPKDGEGEADDEATRKSRHQRRKEQMERIKREGQEAEKRLREHQERIAKAQEAAQGSAQPQETQFKSYEEYLVALGAWHAGKTLDDRQSAEMQRQQQEAEAEVKRIREEQNREVAQGWADQVEDAKTRYQDFEQVAYTAPISDDMAQMIAQMDRGADVAYQLGLNKAEAARIASLSPHEQAMELGRMEARLSAPAPRTQSQAPDPVEPVRPKSSSPKDPAKMSMSEYRAWRAKQG